MMTPTGVITTIMTAAVMSAAAMAASVIERGIAIGGVVRRIGRNGAGVSDRRRRGGPEAVVKRSVDRSDSLVGRCRLEEVVGRFGCNVCQ